MRKLLFFTLLALGLVACTKKQAPYADIALGDDIQGPVLRYAIFGFEDDNYSYRKKYNLRFDTTGVLLEDNYFYYDREERNEEGERTDYSEYQRDEQGRIVRGEHYLNGNVSVVTYTYDEKNRLIHEDFHAGSDSAYRITTNYYGEDGHIAYRITQRRNGDCTEHITDSLVFTIVESDERGNWTERHTDCYFTTVTPEDGGTRTTRTNMSRVEYRFIQYYDQPDPIFSNIVSASTRKFSKIYYNEYEKQYTQVDYLIDYPDSLTKGNPDKLINALARTLVPYSVGNTIEKRLDQNSQYGNAVSEIPANFKGKYLHVDAEIMLSHQNGDLITYFVNDQSIARGVNYNRTLPHYINFDTRNNEQVFFRDLFGDKYYDELTNVISREAKSHSKHGDDYWQYMNGDFYFNARSITVFYDQNDLSGLSIDMAEVLLSLGNRGRRFLAPYLVRYHELTDGRSFIPYGMHMDTHAFSLLTDNQLFVKLPYDGTILVEEHEVNPELPLIQTWEGTVSPTGETYAGKMKVYKYHMHNRNTYRNNSLLSTRNCDCYGKFAIGSDGSFVLLNTRADNCGNNFNFGGCPLNQIIYAGEDGTVG